MSSSQLQTNAAGDGEQSYLTTNKRWRIITRKMPILKAEPIDKLHEKLSIPIPEMIFGDNLLAIEHVATSWRLDFNASDALDRVSKTSEGMLQVAYSKEWQKDRYRAPRLFGDCIITDSDLVSTTMKGSKKSSSLSTGPTVQTTRVLRTATRKPGNLQTAARPLLDWISCHDQIRYCSTTM